MHIAISSEELRVLQVKPLHAVQVGLGYMKLAQVAEFCGGEGGGGEGGGGEGGGEGVRGNWKYALHLGVVASRAQSEAHLAMIFTVATPLLSLLYPSSVHMHCFCRMQCCRIDRLFDTLFGRYLFSSTFVNQVMKRASCEFRTDFPHSVIDHPLL